PSRLLPAPIPYTTLFRSYQRGVEEVGRWRETWDGLAGQIDEERHRHVAALLHRQHDDAKFWRDACLSYFQTFSKRPIPEGVPEPDRKSTRLNSSHVKISY